MAIPTLVAVGTSGEGVGAVTPGMPTGATTGDILVCLIEGAGEDANSDLMTDMGAWTEIGSVANATAGAADDTRHTLHWAPYSAGINREVADAGDHVLARIVAFRGCDTTTPIHKSQSSFSDTPSTAVSVTGVTTTVNDCLIFYSSSAGDDVTTTSWVNAALADPTVTQSMNTATLEGSDGHLSAARGGLATAGASGTATATRSDAENQANWCIALAPAGASPPAAAAAVVTTIPQVSRSGDGNRVVASVAGSVTVPQLLVGVPAGRISVGLGWSFPQVGFAGDVSQVGGSDKMMLMGLG